MICVPVSAGTNGDMLAMLGRAALEDAEAHEIRFDAMSEMPKIEHLVKASTRPVLATCRSRQEGGGFDGTRAERRNILRRAVKAGAAYVDAETDDLDYLDYFAQYGAAIRILSLHDFAGTPEDLTEQMYKLAEVKAADWVKFAVFAKTPADNVRVFDAMRKCPKPVVGIAMGEIGIVSRIVGQYLGSRITFGSIGSGTESAPGQPTAKDLKQLYRINSINVETEIHALLSGMGYGFPEVRATNMQYADTASNAVCIPFPSPDASSFMESIPGALNVTRISVVAPYQRAILRWANTFTDSAKGKNAANLLTRADEGWLADYIEV
jgi:3-dehydroquinate dehydratase